MNVQDAMLYLLGLSILLGAANLWAELRHGRAMGDGMTRRARRRASYARDSALYGLRRARLEGGKNFPEAAERHGIAHFQAMDMADNRRRDFSDTEIALAVHAALEGMRDGKNG